MTTAFMALLLEEKMPSIDRDCRTISCIKREKPTDALGLRL